MRRSGLNTTARATESLRSVGSARAKELAAARELLTSDRATRDHDRVLDLVVERVLLDLFSPPRPGDPPRSKAVVVSARTRGRVAAPSAC